MYIGTEDIEIDWDWVDSELSKIERIPPPGRIAAEDCIKEAKTLARPKAISITKKIIDIVPGSIEVEGSVVFPGGRLAAYIKGAKYLHLFLVTIGSGIEESASMWMSKGEFLYGYLLDRIGSLAVESLAEAMEKRLRAIHASNSESVSMRFSPGYCDWPLEEQFALAKVLDFSKAGVHLTEKCMMVPRKSISAMVAIGPGNLFSKTSPQCVVCDKADCDYRRSD